MKSFAFQLRRGLAMALSASAACSAFGEQPAHGKASHVVIMVWDGMRPDFVTPENTPVLYALSKAGVRFRAHHPVYPSSTEVNATAIATGMYPEGSDLLANVEFRPAIDPAKSFNTENMDAIRKGDLLTGGRYLQAATLPEILHARGLATAVAGTKDVVLLFDRSADRPAGAAGPSPVLFEGRTLPASELGEIANQQGPFPEDVDFPDRSQNSWTVGAMTGVFWKDGVPPLSVLWMSDPDYSQHATGPGSPISLAAIKSCDEYLGAVLKALESKGVRNQTDVMVVSDHGFSTVKKQFSLENEFQAAGFHANHLVTADSRQDEIMVVPLGGTDLLYIPHHDRGLTQKAVEFLEKFKSTGVIFTREKLAGALPLEAARINTSDAPDIVVSFRWEDAASPNGTKGLNASDGRYKPGQGNHASLSPYDLHNTLIAAGPDFRKNFEDYLPSGNVDVAPTIAWILGVTPPRQMNGRILTEALVGGESSKLTAQKEQLRAADGNWEETLDTSKVGDTLYLDRGQGTYTGISGGSK